MQNLIDAEALLDLFQKEPSVKDGKKTLNFKSGAVEFRGVGFSYDGQKEVIKDFNFQAQPGQRVALVGETGGGKSTILRLLFRFYDAQNGSVVIDDQDVRDITLSSLRENIGVVPQDPSLFHESIMENVRYARSDATDQEVMEACKAASIHDKILTFSKGYSTRVGEAGVVLSGGELQRVAIARVILKNPRIILLDEATSSVDTETETRITNALHLLTNGRTTFTVAHRLSTVKNSDIVLVIKDGMIAEQGSPRDLLAGKGEFSKLWLAQMEINLLPADLKPADPVRAEQHAELGDALHASSRQDNRRSSDGSAGGNKSLRATAPDFVPRLQAGTSTSAQVRTSKAILRTKLAIGGLTTTFTLCLSHDLGACAERNADFGIHYRIPTSPGVKISKITTRAEIPRRMPTRTSATRKRRRPLPGPYPRLRPSCPIPGRRHPTRRTRAKARRTPRSAATPIPAVAIVRASPWDRPP